MGFIRTRLNSSDPLFKDIAEETLLLGLLRDGKFEHEVAEFIIDDMSLPATYNAPAGG